MLDELMRQLAASFIGLVVGWFVGSEYCKRKTLKIVEGHEIIHRWSDSRFLGIILISMALLTTAMASVTSWQAQEQARCFTDYNEEFVKAYTARAKAADKDRASFNSLILSLNTPDSGARAKAFAAYIEEIRHTDAERARNPVPNPPDPNKYCERR